MIMDLKARILNRIYSSASFENKPENDLNASFRWVLVNSRSFINKIFILIMIDAAGSLIGVASAVCSKHVIDSAVAGQIRWAVIYGSVFVALIIFDLGLGVISSLMGIRITEAISNTIRQKVYDRLTRTEWLLLSSYHSGDLLTRLTSDVSTITAAVVSVFPGMISLGVQLAAAFLTLLHYDPKLAIFALILGPFTVLAGRLWGRRLRNIHVKVQETESVYRSYIQETLQNLLIVKTFGLEEQSKLELQKLHENRMKWILKRNRISVAASTSLGIGFWISYLFSFGWGVYGLATKTITFGIMTAYLQLVQQIQMPFRGLAMNIPQLIAAWGSTDRIMELEALDKEEAYEPVPKLDSVGILFDRVSFSYNDGQQVLNDITAHIQPGEIVALTGSSGEGKTTMLRLLLALANPDNGRLGFTDNEGNIYPATAATRSWVTYVPQGNTLFSGTIAQNLQRGKPNTTQDEMMAAVKASGAGEFLADLPEGLDTVIGERGLGLSEGQAQRLAIARAILKKSPVMILDEATSALDLKTELHVLNSLKNLGYPCTCLIVTHRPSALKICSRVFQLDNGSLVEQNDELEWTELNEKQMLLG